MIEKIFVITTLVFFIWGTFQDGNIFEKVGNYFEEKLGEFWCKPVTCCVVCMMPYYGSALYWLLYANSWQEWLLVVFVSAGLAKIITTLSPN